MRDRLDVTMLSRLGGNAEMIPVEMQSRLGDNAEMTQ